VVASVKKTLHHIWVPTTTINVFFGGYMKGFFFAALMAASLFIGSNAEAGCELYGCTTLVSADITSYQCDDDGTCTYAQRCSGCICSIKAPAYSCGMGWSQIDTRISDNYRVCAKWGGGCALATGEIVPLEERKQSVTQSKTGDSLEGVFAPNQVTGYYGFAGTTNRSPTYGRSVSSTARLDICMGANDVDAAIATNNATTCYNQYCGTSYNEYCNANSAAVCQDRCECSINGQTHSTCNQL
jgi:hypothetical protein